MKLDIDWLPICTPDVRRMRHWRDAERICKAVAAFAEDGSGRVERVVPGDPSRLRIRAQGGVALVRIDAATRTLVVLRIFSA
jgi:hypothetical protein